MIDLRKTSKKVQLLSTAAYDKVMQSGGVTVNTKNGEHSPKIGYMISLPMTEKIVPLIGFNADIIAEYIHKTGELNEENIFLGIWADAGKVYLDCSIMIEDLDKAVKRGNKYNQLAIYDNVNQKVINLR